MTRALPEDALLETIYTLARVDRPADDGPVFRGHPLAARPRGAAAVFYLVWPVVAIAAMRMSRREATAVRGTAMAPRFE